MSARPAPTCAQPDPEQPEEFLFLRWGFDIRALRGLLQRTSTPAQQTTLLVADATRLISSDPTTTVEGRMSFPLVGVEIRWDHVDELPEAALSAPVFIAPLGGLGHIVIDGWHRIALARRLGVEQLPGLLITRRHASRILLPGSDKLPPEAG